MEVRLSNMVAAKGTIAHASALIHAEYLFEA